MVLCPVGFKETVLAVVPETSGLVDDSPRLHGVAELPVPVGWGL